MVDWTSGAIQDNMQRLFIAIKVITAHKSERFHILLNHKIKGVEDKHAT